MLCELICGKKIKSFQNRIDYAISENGILNEKLINLEIQLNNVISQSSKTKKELLVELSNYEKQLLNYEDIVYDYGLKLAEANIKIIPDSIHDLIESYNNKYETKQVNHVSYMFSKSNLNFNMDIRGFITPHNFIIEQWNNSHNIPRLTDKLVDGIEFHQACDEVINDLIKKFYPSYHYDHKEWEQFNVGDMWQMPFQTVKTNFKGDCEDLSNAFISLAINRGIPAGLIRNSCGVTVNGGGHSTVNYLASDLLWHHIEATARNVRDVKNLPEIHDSSDGFNIKTVWYSFNSEYSWVDWDSTAVNSWKKFKKNKQLKIR